MRASVVIRTKDEGPRLRLTLASLAAQTAPAEVVVVNDGSSDNTPEVIGEADLPIVRIDHPSARGRAAASNAGAEAASGDLLIFLDGDTLAGPEFVARHLALHQARANMVGRGETFHLRCTRLLRDPETGAPMAGEEDRVATLGEDELSQLMVTRGQIAGDFASIDRRAQPGIYPGAGPRRLYELEMDALISHPDCQSLWAAASGANQSVARAAFLDVGGMDAKLTINAHREVALRLTRAGLRMAPALGARSYHMTHRRGWRDPLSEADWETEFYARHPIPETALLSVLWSSFSDSPALPPEARLHSLPAFDAAARRLTGVSGLEAVRRAHLAACLAPEAATMA